MIWKQILVSISAILFTLSTTTPVSTPRLQTGNEVITVTQVDRSDFPNITVYFRVEDSSGRRVDGLSSEQISVMEDAQDVELLDFSASNAEAITSLLVMDQSGSMDENNKLRDAKSAAKTFLRLMRGQDRAGLISFDEQIYTRQDFTTNIGLVENEIDSIRADGGTAWYDAVITGVELIESEPGRRSLVLLSDGLDSSQANTIFSKYGSFNTFRDALTIAEDAEIPVIAIAFGSSRDDDLDEEKLQQIATATNGEYHHAPNGAELEQIYANLAQNLQDEYVLVYKSPRPTNDGTKRDIQISIDGGATGSATFLEPHLLNLDSSPVIAGILYLLMGGLLFVPNINTSLFKRRKWGSSEGHPSGSDHESTSTAVDAPSNSVPEQPNIEHNKHHSCFNCGHILKPNAKFCTNCGANVSNSCLKCATPYKSLQSKFCGSCGLPRVRQK